MKSQNDAGIHKLYQSTSRIQQLIILNLLTFLFLTVFCAQTLFARAENNQQQTEKTIYSPTPLPNAIFILNFSSILTPTVTTERILSADVSVAERRQHVAWYAESLTNRGIRYHSGSSSVENGFDCSGFVHYVMNYFDIKTKRSSSDMYNEGIQVPVALAKTGDLVFFGSKKDISHVAMVASNDEKGLVIIHSCSRGIMKENVTESKYWKSKLKEKAVNIIGF